MVPRLLNNLANGLIPTDHAYIISDTCLPIGPLKNLKIFGFVFLLPIKFIQVITIPLQHPLGSFDTLNTSGSGYVECLWNVDFNSPNQLLISACLCPQIIPWSLNTNSWWRATNFLIYSITVNQNNYVNTIIITYLFKSNIKEQKPFE